MFDWQAIGTHAIEMLVGGVGTWLFTNVIRCRRDIDAAFKKMRDLQAEIERWGPQ